MKLALGFFLYAVCCQAQTNELLKEWHRDPDLAGAGISFCVLDARNGEVVTEFQSGLSLIPASTLKIFTTGAALGILGPDYRYETILSYSGTFDDKSGIIDGDLHITGSGDPSLQSAYFGTGDVCTAWAQLLYDRGIREIKGEIKGESGLWKREIPDHWIWADVSNYFGAVPSALSFKDNKFSIIFSSGKPGTEAKVLSIEPQYEHQKVVTETSVVCEGHSDKAYIYGDPFGFERRVRGSIPAGKGSYAIEGALPDPALLCAETLKKALAAKGIRCRGNASSVYTNEHKHLTNLHTHYSPPLRHIVQQTNIHSNNHFCESLVLTLGKGDMAAGLAAVRLYWKERGLETRGLFLADGSGLSRASTCNTGIQARALAVIYGDSVLHRHIAASLPGAGEQGSMRYVGDGTFLQGNMRAKTGYIQRVRAYCGYVNTRDGKPLVFSVIFNNYNCSPAQARRKIEAFLVRLPDL